jgi:AraC-type DNA-binding domain-containing proteins
MNFEAEFLNALLTSFSSAKNQPNKNHIPIFMPVSPLIEESLSYVQAYGDIRATYPFSYEISDLASHCILLTEKGSGILHQKNTSIILETNTLAFFDCRDKYKIEITHAPWEFKQFFISGPSVAYFYHTFNGFCENAYTISSGSNLPEKAKILLDYLKNAPQKTLLHAKYLTEMLFELLLDNERIYEKASFFYHYLYDIKKDLDLNYLDSNITLEALERKHHVSKYRICREFTQNFKISPIQYLYRKKIEAAKKELIQTDKKINEIGRMIGFDNTNNFIRQFKKQTGVTPLVYRKQNYTG